MRAYGAPESFVSVFISFYAAGAGRLMEASEQKLAIIVAKHLVIDIAKSWDSDHQCSKLPALVSCSLRRHTSSSTDSQEWTLPLGKPKI